MREMKFRVYDKDNKQMFYTDESYVLFYRQGGEEPDFWALRMENMPLEICNNKSGILMQFTGLQDSKGQDIYEGDIVAEVDEEWEKEEVKIGWHEVDAFDVYGCNIHGFSMHGEPIGARTQSEVVVIGNIYENPNLVKGQTATPEKGSE